MEYLIIGASAAGLSAAHALARKFTKASITLVTKHACQPYNTCLIKYVLDGSKSVDDILLPLPPGVTLFRQERIIELNHHQRFVVSATGRKFFYHTLIVAIGTLPREFPTALQYKEKGLFTYHGLDDVKDILYFIHQRGNALKALIIGGGLSGIEAACALRLRSVAVTLIERAGRIAPEEDSEVGYALKQQLDLQGVISAVRTYVHDILLEGDIFMVSTSTGVYRADMVLVTIGCFADTQWLSAVSVQDKQGYIVRVNDNYAHEISAIGDCVAQPRVRNGWARALMQGKQIVV